jgi:hypothetical protein
MVTPVENLTHARIGLRSYDISLGFRNVDERNATITEFSRTHVAGMAVTLAGAIKGHEIIRDVPALKRVAADVLRISPWAFEEVLRELAEVDLIRNVRSRSGETAYFTENVPLLHDDVHHRLGGRWLDSDPTELESQLVLSVEALADAPIPSDELRESFGIDHEADQMLRAVAIPAELVRYHRLTDGTEIAVSPLHAFEHPDSLVPLFENHPTDKVREAFSRVRSQPGYPVILGQSDSIVEEMVSLGLVPAPTVVGADSQKRAFLIVPYGLDPDYLTSKKQVLERALAIIACVRCGEVSGGATPIQFPDALLRKLMDPDCNYTLKPHSSTLRQYAPLMGMGVVETVPDSATDRLSARLVPTVDNIEAVELARILLRRRGEGDPERAHERDAAKYLFTGREYLTPIQTIASTRDVLPRLTPSALGGLWAKMVGWES